MFSRVTYIVSSMCQMLFTCTLLWKINVTLYNYIAAKMKENLLTIVVLHQNMRAIVIFAITDLPTHFLCDSSRERLKLFPGDAGSGVSSAFTDSISLQERGVQNEHFA